MTVQEMGAFCCGRTQSGHFCEKCHRRFSGATCRHMLLADKFRKFGSPSALPWIKCDECGDLVHQEALRWPFAQ